MRSHVWCTIALCVSMFIGSGAVAERRSSSKRKEVRTRAPAAKTTERPARTRQRARDDESERAKRRARRRGEVRTQEQGRSYERDRSVTAKRGRETRTRRVVRRAPAARARALPQIERVSPSQARGSTTVTIYGSGFAKGDIVQVGDVRSRVVTLRPNQITVRLPDSARGGRVGVRRGSRLVWSRRPITVAPPAPAIEALSVRQGQPGSVVRLRGAHFGPRARVLLGKRQVKVRRRGPDFVEVIIPPNATSGRFTVIGRRGHSARSAGVFTVLHPPQIRRVSPQRAEAGATITIHGTGFRADDRVMLGNRELQLLSVGPRRINAQLPLLPGRHRLVIRRGQLTVQARQPISILPASPIIESLSLQQAAPGAVVRIRGRHLASTRRVTLGGRPVTVRNRGPRFLEVVVPMDAQSGQFIVTGPRGRRVTSSRVFTVDHPPRIRRFSPRRGSAGDTVQIVGAHFDQGDAVYLGNRPLQVRRITERQIIAVIPPGARSGRLSVRRGDTIAEARAPFDVLNAPRIASFRPASGAVGARVMLSGSNFTPDTRVTLNGRNLPVEERRLPTQLWVRIPAGSRSGTLVVSNAGGSARTTRPFDVYPPLRLQRFLPRRAAAGEQVQLFGRGFHEGVEVRLGGIQLPVSRLSPRKLTVTIPPNARSGRFRISNGAERVESRRAFNVRETAPAFDATLSPRRARPGSEVTLSLRPGQPRLRVTLNGRRLPKKVYDGGRRVVLTVPARARSGFLEVEADGQRVRVQPRLEILR
jgi:hypothetical protein